MKVGEKVEINQVRYEIVKRVGEGSFGQVFRARNLANQKEVAIKIQGQMSAEEQNLMQTMKGKNFRNLINVYDFTRDENSNYLIIMEYCTESLFDRLNKSKIKPDEIRFIMKEIANGIKELHDLKLAHRDIKPENILIQQVIDQGGVSQEIYKICDFGTAKEVDVMQTAKVGTPYYLAPEQITSNPQNRYSQKVDIWAFGAVIYELLTGYPMFNGYSEQQVWNKIKNSKQEDINKIIDQDMKIERKYRTLLYNMLLIDSSKRYSIEQVVKDLRADSVVVTRGQHLNLNKKEVPTTQQTNQIQGLINPQQLQSKQREALPANFQNIQKNNYFQNKDQKDSIQDQNQYTSPTMKPFLSPQPKVLNNQTTNVTQGLNSSNNNQQNSQIGNSQTLNNPTNLTVNNQFGGRASQLGNQMQNKFQPSAQQLSSQNTNKNLEQNNQNQFIPRTSNIEPTQQYKGYQNRDQQNPLFQQNSQQNQTNFQDNQNSEQNNQSSICNRNPKFNPQQQNYALQNAFQQNQPIQQSAQQSQNNFQDFKNTEQNNQNQFNQRTSNMGAQQQNQAFQNGFKQNQPALQSSQQNQNNLLDNKNKEQNNQTQFNQRNSNMGAQQLNQAFKNGSNINQSNNQFNNNFQNKDQPLQPPQKFPQQTKQTFDGSQMLQKQEGQNIGSSNQGRMSNFQSPQVIQQQFKQPTNQITNQATNQTKNAGYFPNTQAMEGLQAPTLMRQQHNQQFNQINTQNNPSIRGRQQQ